MFRKTRKNAIAAVAVLIAGCTYSVPGSRPSGGVSPPDFRPRIEHTVGAFGFAWNDAEPSTSNVDGRLLSDEVVEAWAERGYIAGGARFVKAKEFSGEADYNLTLSGNQRNRTSFLLEVVNALTLTIAPYRVTQRYELTCVLEDVKSGKTYSATAEGSDFTDVSIFMLPAFPFARWGHRTSMLQMGDSLYEQFRSQGAFESPRPLAAATAP